jgi:rubrerythrin
VCEVDVKTAKGIYRQFIQFEEKAASLYLRLASRFSSNPKLSWLWFEMAMQEKQHAGLLQFCLNEGLFVQDLPTDDEIAAMTRVVTQLEERAANPKLTVKQAFSLAIELESSEINAIYSQLTTALHNSPYLVKRKIATLIPHHMEKLIAAGRKFGVAEKSLRQARLAGNHRTAAH